jgi:hypothetical protein
LQGLHVVEVSRGPRITIINAAEVLVKVRLG